MENKGSLGERREVIRAVLKYLIKNPDAKDTTEGVRRWWLPEDYRKQRREELEEILDFLVSKTWLTIRMTTQQKKIYGLNKECLEQIKDCLKNADNQEPGEVLGLHSADVLQGKVLDLSASGVKEEPCAIIEVEGLKERVIVPFDRLNVPGNVNVRARRVCD